MVPSYSSAPQKLAQRALIAYVACFTSSPALQPHFRQQVMTTAACCPRAPQEFAQRALIAYVRSVFLQPNKKVFDVTKLPVVEYAQSLGLLTAPKLRFLKKVGWANQGGDLWLCSI